MADQNSSISNFKRFLLRILLPLLLTLVLVGVAFDYFFEKKMIFDCELCGAYKVNRILTETHAEEIPIFGSSRAESGFIPDSLGPGYFNYGLSGTRCNVTLFFIEQECKKKKEKPWIILNMDLEGLTSALGDIANYIPNSNYKSVRRLLHDNYRFYYSVPMAKYYGRFENYIRDYLNNRMQLTRLSNKGAALEMNALTNQEFSNAVAERKKKKAMFTADSALKARLLYYITAYSNRTFVFVIPPYHAAYFYQYMNPDEAERFITMLRSYKNVKVLDFSKMPLDDSMFLNTTHINYKGAIVFNRALKDSLTAIGVR